MGNRAWHWARPAGTRVARGGAPGPGMWGARPLAELSPVGRPAAEPTPRPSLGAPIGLSHSTRPTSHPPGWKPGCGVGGRSGKAGERSSWLGSARQPIRTRRGEEAPRQPVTSRSAGWAADASAGRSQWACHCRSALRQPAGGGGKASEESATTAAVVGPSLDG